MLYFHCKQAHTGRDSMHSIEYPTILILKQAFIALPDRAYPFGFIRVMVRNPVRFVDDLLGFESLHIKCKPRAGNGRDQLL